MKKTCLIAFVGAALAVPFPAVAHEIWAGEATSKKGAIWYGSGSTRKEAIESVKPDCEKLAKLRDGLPCRVTVEKVPHEH